MVRRGFAGGFGGFAAGGAGARRATATSSEPTAADKKFVAWLEAHRDGAKYLVAVDSSMAADDLIIASGKPVMAMGGFSGSDPTPTLAQFEQLVREGRVRYVLVGTAGGGGGGAGPVRSAAAAGPPEPVRLGAADGFASRLNGKGGNSTVTAVERWVEAHGTKVPVTEWGGEAAGTLYEVTPASS